MFLTVGGIVLLIVIGVVVWVGIIAFNFFKGPPAVVPESAFPEATVRATAQAIADGNSGKAIEQVAEAGLIDYIGPENDTLLLVAVMGNDEHAVKKLLELGTNPNIPEGRSPLAIAAGSADIEIIRALLSAGADPDGLVDSESGLWRAALGNRRDIVDLFLENGATIDLPNSNGETPLIVAAQVSHYELSTHLLERGASPFSHDSTGKTAEFWASRKVLQPGTEEYRNREQLLQLLQQKGFPSPAPTDDEVLEAKAAGNWPPQ